MMTTNGHALDKLLLEQARAALVTLRADAANQASREAIATIERLLSAADSLLAVEDRLRRNHERLSRLAQHESLSKGELGAALEAMTEAACEVLGVARSSVWTYGAEKKSIRCVDLYLAGDDAHERGIELPAATYPAYFEALSAEVMIAANDAHTDRRTSEFSAGYLRPLGIESMLDAPIRVGGRMIGVLCNEHTGQSRVWTDDEQQFASHLAALIALAFESSQRRDAEAQLRAMVEALDDEPPR